jgi:hypothetical protein
MGTPVAIQMTRKGLLIPRDALGDLVVGELEAVRAGSEIIIRRKRASADERDRVRHVLRAAGLLYEPDWNAPPPVENPCRDASILRASSRQPGVVEKVNGDGFPTGSTGCGKPLFEKGCC